jgi:hypothetical protein
MIIHDKSDFDQQSHHRNLGIELANRSWHFQGKLACVDAWGLQG